MDERDTMPCECADGRTACGSTRSCVAVSSSPSRRSSPPAARTGSSRPRSAGSAIEVASAGRWRSASAGLVALMIALTIPSATACEGVIETSARPTASRPVAELGDRQRAGDAAGVGAALGALLGVEPVLGDDVGDADPAARPEDAGDLGEDGALVGGEVDDAVADDDVDRLGRQRDRLDVALEELDVGGAGLGGVALGEREHLVGHVEAEGAAGRADPLRRQQDVDPAARAEVEDPLALVEVGDGGRVAAAEGRQDGRVRAARRARAPSTGPAPMVSRSPQHDGLWEARSAASA